MSQPPKIQFRNVAEGAGKVFTLTSNRTASPLPFGTRNCHSCVGLMLPLPGKSCAYVAHINAWVLYEDDKGSEKYDRVASKVEGDQIKAIVQARLRAVFAKYGWAVDDVEPRNVVVICPGIDLGGSWNQSTGWYVVDALKEVFGRQVGVGCDQRSHGFVYDSKYGELETLSDLDFRQEWFHTKTWKQRVDGVEKEFTAVNEEADLDLWDVEVKRA